MKWVPKLTVLFVGMNSVIVLTCLRFYYQGEPRSRMLAVGLISSVVANLTALATLRWLRTR